MNFETMLWGGRKLMGKERQRKENLQRDESGSEGLPRSPREAPDPTIEEVLAPFPKPGGEAEKKKKE